MANRYLRDSFPAEWVIQCALETGTSLLWLATGQGDKNDGATGKESFDNVNRAHIKPLSEVVAPEIESVSLNGGIFVDHGTVILDSSLIPSSIKEPLFIRTDGAAYLVDRSGMPPANGAWLVDIDGVKSIANLVRIPGNKLIVHQGESSFECSIDDIEIIGRALKVIKNL